MVALSIDDFASSLKRSLTAEIDVPPLRAIEKCEGQQPSIVRCKLDKNYVLNTFREPWAE